MALTEPSPQVVQQLVPEFFRVVSLVPVVLGRADYVVGASGSTLLRTMLIEALVELISVEDRGGALSLRRLLPAEQYDVIGRMPAIEATRASVIAVHRYGAEQFVAVSHELCTRTDTEWPADFVRSVAQRTEPQLGAWLG